MLIHASFSQSVSLDGSSMVYIPEGINEITPSVNGKPKRITVKVPADKGEAIAKALQASFDARNKVNPVRAIFDFDHKDTGPAAAIPKRFFYEKGQGIMVERELTGSGKKAIESKDYSYFSPTFLIDENGTPVGVPERGPLGALVNDPAFRNIPCIAAKEAHTETNPTNITMSLLVTCGLLSEAEGAKDNAVTLAQQRVTAMRADTQKIEALNTQVTDLTTERDDLKQKLEAAQASITKAKEDSAKTLITAAIADGRIAAKDEDTQKFWQDCIINQGDSAVKALDALPKQHEGITNPVVSAKQGDKVNDGEGVKLVAAARKLVTAGEFPNEDAATQHLCSQDPKLYESYLASLETPNE